jgi:MFS family permease
LKPERLLKRLMDTDALPDTRGRRTLVAAVTIDTLGVGLFLPLAFYFFTVSSSLSVTGIGATITGATVTALVLAPVGGVMADRWGPRNMVVTSNLLTAAGYFCYPFASSYLQIFGCVVVVMFADRLYFAAWPTLITAVAAEGQLDAWFALMQALGAGAIAVGALLSSVLLAHSGVRALELVVTVNAATSVVAAVLTAALPRPTRALRERTSTWIDLTSVLRDRPFRRILVAQLLISSAWIVPGAFLPLYVARTLHLGQWQTMLAFSLNYLLLFTFQLSLTHRLRGTRRTRAVSLGAGLFVMSMLVFGAAPEFGSWAAMAVIVAAVMVYSFGEMLCAPSSSALASMMAPQHLRGMYMSLFQLTGAIAFGLGPGLVGLLFRVDPRMVLATVGLCVATGAGVLLRSEHLLSREALLRA